MTNLTAELVARVKAAKSAEELLELAKENNIALSEEEAKTYFEQLHANAAVSDDDLEAVAGGGICEWFEEFFRTRSTAEVVNCPNNNDKIPQPTNLIYDRRVTPMPFEPDSKNRIISL